MTPLSLRQSRTEKRRPRRKNIRAAWPALILGAGLFLFAGLMPLPRPALGAQKSLSPLDMPMPDPLPPIPPLEKTSPAKQNRLARERIKKSMERMRAVIRMHREMRGLKPVRGNAAKGSAGAL